MELAMKLTSLPAGEIELGLAASSLMLAATCYSFRAEVQGLALEVLTNGWRD